MNRLGISVIGVVAAVVMLMAGCRAARPTAAGDEPAKDPNTQTLFAELALEHGDCKLAADDYAAAARHSGAAIAKRASEVGLACQNLPAAWQSVQRWRELAPADAASTCAAIALKLYKIPEARACVATAIAAAGANTDARIAELTSGLLEDAEAPALLAVMSEAVGPKASPETLTVLAALALDAYNSDKAARYAREALNKKPELAAAKRVLARVYVMQGDAAGAISATREIMAAEPKISAFDLAEILVALGRREEARQELERLRALGGATTEVDQRLAILAFEEGDLAEAQRRFTDLAARNEVGEGVILYLADIASRDGDKAAALAGYRQLQNSNLALTARTRAAAILIADDRTAAFTLLDDYAVAHPEQSFSLTITKAHLLADHGESDAGIALLEASLEGHPRHPTLEYELSILLERAGNVKGSVALLERMIAERPDDANLLNALGYTLAEHDLELPRAERLIQRALAATPDNPAVLDSLGWVRFRRGDAGGAVPVLEHAYAVGQDADIAAHLGEALWKSGDEARARKVWAQALARDPSAVLLKSTLTRLLPQAS